MAAVTVSRSEGRLIAVKQVPAERAADIQREADLLRRLDHPGLVRFVDLVETADGGRALHTEFVNSDTWASRPLTDPAERAAGMAALAAVVADLHQLGVAHLQLTPPHVLHGENDLPVLCGLTSAAEATPENRHTDLAALADLCHEPALGRGALSGKLFSLADEARAGTLSARELARRLDLLATRRPTRTAPVRVAGGGVLDGLKRRCRPKPLLRAGAVVVAVFAAFVVGVRSGDPEPPPAAAAPTQNEAPDDARRHESGPARRGTTRSTERDPVAEPELAGGQNLIAEPELVSERDLVAEPGQIALPDPTAEPGPVAATRPRRRAGPDRGVGARGGRSHRARRASLRHRRHRRLRGDRRLGLRRAGHRGDRSSQHRRGRAVRRLARPGRNHLASGALERRLPHRRGRGRPRPVAIC